MHRTRPSCRANSSPVFSWRSQASHRKQAKWYTWSLAFRTQCEEDMPFEHLEHTVPKLLKQIHYDIILCVGSPHNYYCSRNLFENNNFNMIIACTRSSISEYNRNGCAQTKIGCLMGLYVYLSYIHALNYIMLIK